MRSYCLFETAMLRYCYSSKVLHILGVGEKTNQGFSQLECGFSDPDYSLSIGKSFRPLWILDKPDHIDCVGTDFQYRGGK